MTTLEILKSNSDYLLFVQEESQVNKIIYNGDGISIVFFKIVNSFEAYFDALSEYASIESIRSAQSFALEALQIMKKGFVKSNS